MAKQLNSRLVIQCLYLINYMAYYQFNFICWEILHAFLSAFVKQDLGPKLVAKVISPRQKLPIAWIELNLGGKNANLHINLFNLYKIKPKRLLP